MAGEIKIGDSVEVNYTGMLKKDNSVFDTTEKKEPFRFQVGGAGIIDGMSDAVVGMKVGEKKRSEILPDDAYGEPNDELIRKIPMKDISKKAQVGDILFDSENSNFRWRVKDFKGNLAVLDGNHPLAGETLIFDIEIVSITPVDVAATEPEEKEAADATDDGEKGTEEGEESEEEKDEHIASDDVMRE